MMINASQIDASGLPYYDNKIELIGIGFNETI